MAEHADAIWSVGPDLFAHFHDIFQEAKVLISHKHEQILLQPNGLNSGRVQCSPPPGSPRIRKLFSLWNNGQSFSYKGRKKSSKGSNLQNFFSFGGALASINDKKLLEHEQKLQWNVHGLKDQDKVVTTINSQANGNTIGLEALKYPTCLDDIKLQNCLAFIVLDITEETFNFVALSAIWHSYQVNPV